jgi:hypothetical protein
LGRLGGRHRLVHFSYRSEGHLCYDYASSGVEDGPSPA